MSLELLLFGLGLVSGVLSGLLGIGGAILIVPALLYVPQWVGIASIDIKVAAAVAVAQVVAASATGALAHGRHGLVHGRLAAMMGAASAGGALLGGVVSAYLPSGALLVVAAILASSASLVMILPAPPDPISRLSHPPFKLIVALPVGVAIGLLVGTIGIGSFLMVPTMIYVLRMPTRVGLATVLAVAFPMSVAGLTGKLLTGQVPLLASCATVLGAIPGAQLGSMISVRVPARVLRLLYGALVLTIAAGLWYDVLNIGEP